MSVLVYTENWDGQFKKQTFELLSYGRTVADMLGGSLTALSIGVVDTAQLSQLAAYGADKVLDAGSIENLADSRLVSRMIAEAAGQESARVVLLAHNTNGKGLSPRVAVRLEAGLATAVVAPPISMDPMQVQKKVFSGKAIATQQIQTAHCVMTLAPNAFEVVENKRELQVVAFDPQNLPPVSVRVRETHKQTGKVLLSDAEVVVSGGRGMKGPENWGPIEELAGLLGAATACSRPVSDEGWRPHGEHTGQTGKIIAPNLYFAFGISGAIQHLAGVSSSKCIVAVNTDPDAPIFEAADYGVIGDARKVLPDLIEAIRQVKA